MSNEKIRRAVLQLAPLAALHYCLQEWILHPQARLICELHFWLELLFFAILPLFSWIFFWVLSKGKCDDRAVLRGILLCIVAGDVVYLLIRLIGSHFPLEVAAMPSNVWRIWEALFICVGIAKCTYDSIACRYFKDYDRTIVAHTFPGVAAMLTITFATIVCALHFYLPRLLSTPITSRHIETFLVPDECTEDLHFLYSLPECNGKALGVLLDHIRIAQLERRTFYRHLDDNIYRNCVLSPQIASHFDKEIDWRRTLWQRFRPRIRFQKNPVLAAQIVVRELRESLRIASDSVAQTGIETIWIQKSTSDAGFELIYAAALRSVGIAARITEGRVELFADGAWTNAPLPRISTF